MAYPSLEQYQEALQHPQTAFADPQLAKGRIRTSNLGPPVVISGGFALTYSVETGTTKYAVRCFHREAKGLERRYAAISQKLKGISSPYFVDFEFQPRGVKLNASVYPVVKMAWASGETLGEFVELNHGDKAKLANLLNSLTQLSSYLEQQGIAHGDLQEGNLMVADSGRRVQLIDYDGMFVPEIASLGSSEMGHRDYQHPKRNGSQFDRSLDRFSFMALNLALRALQVKPALWSDSSSGAGVIVFRANDFADPAASSIFSAISQIGTLSSDAKAFAAICRARYSQIPTFSDFLAGKNIPQEIIVFDGRPKPEHVPLGYISQYPVLDASDFSAFSARIGQMVELVGRVVEVSSDVGKYGRGKGKPYIFVNFAPWRGQCVKINLWSEALAKSGSHPSTAWVGRWITIKGLVEPIYRSPKYHYAHIAITAASASQITQLTDAEARYRLKPPRTAGPPTTSANAGLLSQIKVGNGYRSQAPSVPIQAASKSANQMVLDRIRNQANPHSTPSVAGSKLSSKATSTSWASQHTSPPPKQASSGGIPWWAWALGLFVLLVIFGR